MCSIVGHSRYTVTLVREAGSVAVQTLNFNDTVTQATFDMSGDPLHHNTIYKFLVRV